MPAFCLRKFFFGSCFPLRLGRPGGGGKGNQWQRKKKRKQPAFSLPPSAFAASASSSLQKPQRVHCVLCDLEDRLMFVKLSTCKTLSRDGFFFRQVAMAKNDQMSIIFVTTTTTTSSSSSSSSSRRRRRSNNNNRSSSCCCSRSNNNRSSSNNNSRCNKSTRRKTKVYELQIVTYKVQKNILFHFEV